MSGVSGWCHWGRPRGRADARTCRWVECGWWRVVPQGRGTGGYTHKDGKHEGEEDEVETSTGEDAVGDGPIGGNRRGGDGPAQVVVLLAFLLVILLGSGQ